MRTTGAIEVDGEAYVNLRKGKIIPGYEFSAKIDWEATAEKLGESAIKGKIEIPYIADENADEDPEVLVRAPSEEGGEEIRLVKCHPDTSHPHPPLTKECRC